MQLKKIFLIKLDWESIRLCSTFLQQWKAVSELKTKTLLSLQNSTFCPLIVIKTKFNSINVKCGWKEAAFD